jgi:hypothetical protein
MPYTPLNYEQINIAAGTYNPSSVKSYNNKTYAFWERALFQRATSVIEATVPDEWEGTTKDFLLYCLFKFGFTFVFNDVVYGETFQPCTLKGYDWYYQPTDVIIANPALPQSLELKIGKDGELLKLTPDFMGVWDIISYYAEKLSTLDNAINMSLINNKFAFILGARNKVAGQALKKMLDKINKGEPAVIYDMKLLNDPTDKVEPFQVWERKNSLKESYLTTDQLKDFQTILNNFDCEVGIPTIPYEKKERMVQAEATSRQLDAQSRSTIWIECLQSSTKKIKELYPEIKLDFKLRYNPEKEEENEQLNNVPDRAL